MRWHTGYAVVAMALLLLEIGIALSLRDMVIRPYGGEMLAAMLVYCGLRAVTRLRVAVAAIAAFAVAVAIEWAQLADVPGQLGWDGDLIARIVVGNAFDPVDVAAYAAGAAIVMTLEAVRAVRAGHGVDGRIGPTTLWALTLWLPAGLVAVNLVYWPAMLASDALPPESDAILIPMFAALPAGGIVAIVVGTITWWALRGSAAACRPLAWCRDRPVWSWGWSFLLGGSALLITADVAVNVASCPPPYELLWDFYGLTLAGWLAALRSVVVMRGSIAKRQIG